MLRRVLVIVMLFTASCRMDTELPAPTLRGSVSGALDTGARSHETLEVALIDARGGKTTQLTDAAGAFVFSDLSPGAYTFIARVPTFAPYLEPGVLVKAGEETKLGTLALDSLENSAQAATLSGKVAAMGSGDITGALVEMTIAGQRLATAPVFPDGTFSQLVPPGTYVVRASHPNFVSAELSGVVVLPATPKDISSTPLVLGINPAKLVGVVMLEQEGLPSIAGAGVSVLLSTGENTVTDATGHFQLQGLAAGPRTVELTFAGYHDALPSHSVTLQPSKTTDLGTVTLALLRGTITGNVKMADNSDVSGATVSVLGKAYGATVSRDATDQSTGRFIISGVPLGQYDLRAARQGYSPFVTSVTVVVGSASAGTLTLTKQVGDFDIDDGDSSNLGGYTRNSGVTLKFTGFPSTGVASYRASEDATFSAGNQAFDPYTSVNQPFTLSSGDGTKTVYAQYKDALGQPSPVFSSNIVLDTVAPTVTKLEFERTGAAGTAKFTNQTQNLAFTLFGSDATSGVVLMRVGTALDGSNNVIGVQTTYTSPATLVRPTMAQGNQVVRVQLIDGAGNASAPASDTITVDSIAPAGTISIAKGPRAELAGYTDQPLVTIAPSVPMETNGGVVQLKLANAAGAELASAVLQAVHPTMSWFLEPVDGSKTVSAIFVDSAGNASSAVSANIELDTAPPNPASASVVGASLLTSLNLTLSLTASATELAPDGGLTVSESSVFQGPTTVGPQPFPVSATRAFVLSDYDGPHTVFVRFTDKAGNESVATVPVQVDRVAPTLALSVSGALADGTPSATLTSTTAVTALIISSERVKYVIGNETLVCPAASSSSWVDLTVPQVAYTLSGAVSPRQVKACVMDAAGNITGPAVVSIALDASPPSGCTVSLTGRRADASAALPPAGKTGSRDISYTLGCSEVPTEILLTQDPSVTCANNSVLAWQPFAAATTQNFTLTGVDGVNSVRGCVRDAARNVGTIAAQTITLDTTPPASPSIAIDGTATYLNLATKNARGSLYGVVTNSVLGANEWVLSSSPSTFGAWVALTASSNFPFSGEGVATVYAKFRDDVGNETAVASDSIIIDTLPPTVGGSSLVLVTPSPDQSFTNSVSVTATLPGLPSDVWQVKLLQAANAATCTLAEFAAVAPLPASNSYTFVLSSTEAAKRVCAQYLDQAGNEAALADLVSDTVTLDTTAPTTPIMQTSSAILPIANGGSFDVVVTASTDLSTVTYEIVGGAVNTWTPTVPTSMSPVTLQFSLSNTGAFAGTDNDLRVRARDQAGNVSALSSVIVTADTVPPVPPEVDAGWVDNGNGQGVVYFLKKDGGQDTDHFVVRYGSSPSALVGVNATQGASPFILPAGLDSVTLTGMLNQSPTYVQLQPVDHAGNQGSPVMVSMLPNEVSPNLLATLNVPGMSAQRLASSGTALYVAGVTNCNGTSADSALQVIDMGRMATAFQSGTIVFNPPKPVLVGAMKTSPDQVLCAFSEGQLVDILVDGIYLYFLSGKHLHIYDASDPRVPVELVNLDVSLTYPSFNGSGLTLGADRLFLESRPASGTSTTYVFSLAKLFDAAAGKPAIADMLTSVANGTYNSASLVISRDRVMSFDPIGFTGLWALNAFEALDGDAVNTVSAIGSGFASGGTIYASTKPVVSGNRLYTQHYNGGSTGYGLWINDLTTAWTAPSGFSFTMTSGPGLANGSKGQLSVEGSESYFVTDQGTLVALDLSGYPTLRQTSAVAGAGVPLSVNHTLIYGNYLVEANDATVRFFELATPRNLETLSVTDTVSYSIGINTYVDLPGWRPMLDGAFLVTSSGNRVFDLQSGTSGLKYAPTNNLVPIGFSACNTGSTMLDDTEVLAEGRYVRGYVQETVFDRNTFTAPPPGDYQNLAQNPANVKTTDVDALGNHLILTHVRSEGIPATDGIVLEVMVSTKWRDRDPATVPTTALDSRGTFRVATGPTGLNITAQTTMWGSKALVTIENATGGSSTGANAFIVDLKPLLDEDPLTTTPTILASFTTPRARIASISPPFVAIPTASGIYVYDATEAFNSPATVVPAGRMPVVLMGGMKWDGTAIYGSYLYAVPSTNISFAAPGLTVFDLSGAAPTLMAVYPVTPHNSAFCCITGDTCRQSLNNVVVRGGRAYFNYETVQYEIGLE